MNHNINPAFQRLALITGVGVIEALAKTRVMVFGLGGVGGWCAEALIRSGICNISIIDSDTVCITNINRQVQAARNTIGLFKAETLKKRLLEINPECNVISHNKVFCEETENDFFMEDFDFVIDAIDSLSCKIVLIKKSISLGKTLFSCMGMAQKLDPGRIKSAGIWETKGCSLARNVRYALRKANFTENFTVVYSEERLPVKNEVQVSCGGAHSRCLCAAGKAGTENAREWCSSKKIINGSAAPVTASAGMILASLVIRHVMKTAENSEKNERQIF